MQNLRSTLALCLLTHIKQEPIDTYLKIVMEAVRGGVTLVQLREKEGKPDDVKQKALALQRVLKPLGIPLLINDFVDLAAEIDADGVHLGQQDMSPAEARKILGPRKIIGLSIESHEELERSNRIDDLNYVTASAIFPSKSKPDCKKIWGLAGLRQIVSFSRHPVTAIGGITTKNAANIIKAGAAGVAVIGAIHDYSNHYEAAHQLRNEIDKEVIKKCVIK